MAQRFTSYGATGKPIREALGSVGDMIQRKKMLADQIQNQKDLQQMKIDAFKTEKEWEYDKAKKEQHKMEAKTYTPAPVPSIFKEDTTPSGTFSVNIKQWRNPLVNPSSQEGVSLLREVNKLANPELTNEQFKIGMPLLTQVGFMMNSDEGFWDSKKDRRQSKKAIATLSSYISLIENARPKDNNVMLLKGLLLELEKTSADKDHYYSEDEVKKRNSMKYKNLSDYSRLRTL